MATVRAARRLNRAAGSWRLRFLQTAPSSTTAARSRTAPCTCRSHSERLSLAVSGHGVADRRIGAHVVRDTVYALAGATGLAGTGFHALQRDQTAGRFLLAQPVLCGTNRRAIGAAAFGVAWLYRRTGARQLRLARRRGSWGSLPVGRWRRSPHSACSELLARPGCCISAAPIITRRCSCRFRCPPVAAGLLGNAALAPRGKDRWFTRWWLRLTAAAWIGWRRVPRLRRCAEHGRLAQLVAECAERAADPGAAQFHRPRTGRSRGSRPAGGPSGCVIATPATTFSASGTRHPGMK